MGVHGNVNSEVPEASVRCFVANHLLYAVEERADVLGLLCFHSLSSWVFSILTDRLCLVTRASAGCIRAETGFIDGSCIDLLDP
ncbi:hypothetical protein SAY87_004021 [Trapa incisa]|uniref:Uncharacterized protein n=1 Tax=Trapa incisa TaxID=236973 RepID=A0AAN7JND9_9MYRT|nr:hypothetical protein SAY87_004021 [Trapa incisa]